MSFILKENPIAVNIKLTKEGRIKLASGNFNVTKFSIGDSEMDYTFYNKKNITKNDSIVLSPKDNILSIRYKIKRSINDNDPTYNIKTLVHEEEVVNDTNIGFFIGDDIYNMKASVSPTYVREGNLRIDLGDLNSVTPRIIRIKQSPDYFFISEPQVGDFIIINWSNIYNNSENFRDGIVNSDNISQFSWYKIISINGNIENDTLSIEVDRDIPNFGLVQGTIFFTYCMILPKGNSIIDYYGFENLSKFWNFTNNNYIENCKGDVFVTPVWSLNIFYPKNNIGFLPNTINPNDIEEYKYSGFLDYINNFQINKMLGIIHYTNSTPTNQIGEGFYRNEAELLMPTILWYKNKDNKIGLRLKCDNTKKRVKNYNINYYDLIDDNGFVVGKCFNDIKIFLIEDQEILIALNYKSNRNWTLPPAVPIINEVFCLPDDLEENIL